MLLSQDACRDGQCPTINGWCPARILSSQMQYQRFIKLMSQLDLALEGNFRSRPSHTLLWQHNLPTTSSPPATFSPHRPKPWDVLPTWEQHVHHWWRLECVLPTLHGRPGWIPLPPVPRWQMSGVHAWSTVRRSPQWGRCSPTVSVAPNDSDHPLPMHG